MLFSSTERVSSEKKLEQQIINFKKVLNFIDLFERCLWDDAKLIILRSN